MAVEGLLQEHAWFKKQYQPGQSALDNYQKVPLLWIEVDRYVEERHPERFKAIRGKYDAELDAINQKMVELERKHAS